MLDSKGFDLWANDYDKSVNLSEASNDYPFAGYREVLNHSYNQVRQKDKAAVLDIGFGTGVLTSKLYNDGYQITGIDFSEKMIKIAREKMPDAKLIRWDFTKGLPDEIKDERFNYIISTYALHHLPDDEKVKFIRSLSALLTETGSILIGDLSFGTRDDMEACNKTYADDWDSDEFYFAADEICLKLRKEFQCEYQQISVCAGVYIISEG